MGPNSTMRASSSPRTSQSTFHRMDTLRSTDGNDSNDDFEFPSEDDMIKALEGHMSTGEEATLWGDTDTHCREEEEEEEFHDEIERLQTPVRSSKTEEIAAEENHKLRQWRLILILVLISVAAAICAGTYVFVTHNTNQDVQNSFTLFANSMEAQLGLHAENLQAGLRNLGDTLTASGDDNDSRSFPFVLVDHFETHGEHARERTKMEALAYAPLVNPQQRTQWEEFAWAHQDWIPTSRATYIDHLKPGLAQPVYLDGKISPFVYEREIINGVDVFTDPVETHYDAHNSQETTTTQPYAPIWYLSPPPFNPAIVNLNVLSIDEYGKVLLQAIRREGWAFSPVLDIETMISLQVSDGDHVHYHQQFNPHFNHLHLEQEGEDSSSSSEDQGGTIGYHLPHSLYAQPVFQSRSTRTDADDTTDNSLFNSNVVGVIWGAIAWDAYLADMLPQGVEGVVVVLHSSCSHGGDKPNSIFHTHDNYYTYELNGSQPTFVGEGDLHDPSYDSMVRTIPFKADADASFTTLLQGHDEGGEVCRYNFRVYPSDTFQESYASPIAFAATATVAMTFLVVAFIFAVYDALVKARNKKVTDIAKKTSNVVAEMFPENVRERLMNDGSGGSHDIKDPSKRNSNSVSRGGGRTRIGGSKPIADLFPEATILFCDMVGFTAWSSMREPSQVFVLLETVYAEFDELARRRQVFKVETIGDCYVACTGVPEARPDHAIVMLQFARDCVSSFQVKCRELEVLLGPDTADLATRVGVHSGPVTAGVLRGDKARFQLFGDSMNTASRIESTGSPNKIHCSQETADLLIAAGKENWVIPREEKVHAKGKGELQTFWVKTRSTGSDVGSDTDHGAGYFFSTDDSSSHFLLGDNPGLSAKLIRLVDWNCEVVAELLKKIVARRGHEASRQGRHSRGRSSIAASIKAPEGSCVIDEVAEIISLPQFDEEMAALDKEAESITLPPKVLHQLKEFVTAICNGYIDDNPFHNFEHASHVTMSIAKLLSRITSSFDPKASHNRSSLVSKMDPLTRHDRTYGITSDPLTQLAVVMAGMIHDLDHPGVPNAQLIKEGDHLAQKYQDKSVAEQHSVDLAWAILMRDSYSALRRCIYGNSEAELSRFRQLIVNAVMATDIVDKDLKQLREARWEKAFAAVQQFEGVPVVHEEEVKEEDHQLEINRKATIVIEHLIQASDIAHTMQHWHIYRKWNTRFFLECYKAYKDGRAEKDPTTYWFKGEIGFFDFYIIPLAKKLKDCGVFGVSSDEYLQYAIKNRSEWETRGEQIVQELTAEAQQLFD